MAAHVKIESNAGVRTISLDRPEVRNAFDDATVRDLTGALQDAAADAATRVVVLTGAGSVFSAGGDLNWMRRMAEYDEARNRADALELAGLMRTLYELPKPTIARVNGAAFGGAVGLTACCDIAIASELAKFSLSEVRLGLIPSAIAPYVVAAIGPRQAGRLFLTAEAFDAKAALEMGLIHQVTSPGGLDAAVNAQVALLMQGGPVALVEAKRMARRLSPLVVDDALMQETAEVIARLRVSDEGQEGLSAFLEKRKPGWTG
jgi:methylglutaconyl-CoA hydratase